MGKHTAPAPDGGETAEGSLGSRAVSGMAWSIVEQWGSTLLASAVFVVLARLIAPKAFGVVAIAGVFVAFANVFVGQAFAQAVIRQRPLLKEHVDTAFWINAGLGAALAALGIGLAPWIAHLQGVTEVKPVLQALSLDFLIGALGGIPEALLQRELRFRQLSVRTLVSNVIADALGVGLAFAGAGVWALVVQTLAQTTIDTAILWAVCPRRPGLHVTRSAFVDMRNFGFNNTGLNVLNLVNRQSDNFLIGAYLGPVKLGFYAVAYQVLNIFESTFVNTVQVVMFPVFSSVSKDLSRLRRAHEMASRMTAIMAFPAFVGLSLVSGQMIPLIFGAKWGPAVPVAEVLAFIGLVHSMTQFNGQVCKAVGRVGIVLRSSSINSVVNLAGFFAAVHYGIFWVAAVYVGRGILLYPLSVWNVRTAIGLDVRHHLRGYVAPTVAVAAMAVVVGLFEHATPSWPAWPRLIASVLVGALVYVPILALLAGREIRTLVEALQEARRTGARRGTRARQANADASPDAVVVPAVDAGSLPAQLGAGSVDAPMD